MREVFRLCFEYLTDPLSLPLDPLVEWIILVVMHELAYRLSFSMVRDLYRSGIISSRLVGSFLHWFFRTTCFLGTWAGINFAIATYRFIAKHWLMIICAIGSILLILILAAFAYNNILQRQRTIPTQKESYSAHQKG